MDCKEHVVSAHRQRQKRSSLFVGFFLNFAGAKVDCIRVGGLCLMRPTWGTKSKQERKSNYMSWYLNKIKLYTFKEFT